MIVNLQTSVVSAIMAMDFYEVKLTKDPISSVPPHGADGGGACLDFWGVVRPDESGRRICGLDYQIHPRMAATELVAVAASARQRFSLEGLEVIHRYGFVPVGEASLLVRVICRHRAPAYEASQWIIEEIKLRVPIWKHPVYA